MNTSQHSRTKFLSLLLKEGRRLVLEQQQPPAQPQPTEQQPSAAPAAETPTPQQTASDVAMGADGKPLTVDSLIERLNVIRGGKSFSDPEVYGQLTTLFKTLTNEEKMSMDKTLMNIGKVVINAPETASTEADSTEDTSAQPAIASTGPSVQQQQAPAQPTTPPAAPPAAAGTPAPIAAV